MGMHFGVLASELSSAELVTRLRAILPPDVREVGAKCAFADLVLEPDDGGWKLGATDHGGYGFLLDSSFLLSGMAPDLVARLAQDSGCLVVAACAETVSGTFVLVVARGDRVLRLHYDCAAELAVPFSQGDPLASESRVSLTDIDGAGLFAAMKELGPDFSALEQSDALVQPLLWTSEDEPATGPLGLALDAHRAKHRLAPDAQPSPQIVMRNVEPAEPPPRPWWRFW